MNPVGWTRRSSNAGPFRKSNQQFSKNDGGGSRQCQSVERHSRIPLKSSNQATSRAPVGSTAGTSLFQQGKQRSKSQAPIVGDSTPVNPGITTPSESGFGSRITPSCSSNRGTMKKMGFCKDNRNLHDKEYLKEAAHIVQTFFQEKCPDLLINGTEIRPMTIKLFVSMVNYLFEALEIVDKRQEPVVFELSTYEKLLPYWTKKLNYPGLITKAWLQTVNVPNNWHHVIGLLSWLVKIVQISELFKFEEILQSQSIEAMETQDFAKAWAIYYFQQSLKAYRLFIEGKEDEYQDLFTEVIKKFYEFNEVDESENEKLEQEIDELHKQLENPDALAEKDVLDEAVQKLKNLELQSDKLSDDIGKAEDEIETIKAKIKEKERNINMLKSQTLGKKVEVEELENVVSKQPTSMSEITELTKKSENIDKEIKFLEKECEDFSQLITRYEVEAASKRDRILQGTHAFNRIIIQQEQTVPELTEFRIYKDPEDEEIITEMENTVAALEKLKEKKVQACEDLKMQIEKKEQSIEEKTQALNNITSVITKLEERNEAKKKENVALMAQFEEKEKLLKEESEKWAEKLTVIEAKVKEFGEVKDIHQKMELRHEELIQTLKETENLAEKFWAKTYDRWKDIPGTLENLVHLVTEQNLDLKRGYNQLITDLENDVNSAQNE